MPANISLSLFPSPTTASWPHGLYSCIATQNSLPLPRMSPHFTDQPHQSVQQDLSPELISLLIYARSQFPQHEDASNTQPAPLRGSGPSFLWDEVNPSEMWVKRVKLWMQLMC